MSSFLGNIPFKRMSAITFLIGALAMLMGPRLWPPSPEITFSEAQHFWANFALHGVEALLFGLGLAFFFVAYPALKNVAREERGRLTRKTYALTWILSSWWPHDNWHLSIGHDIGGLIAIEYTFHATVILAGIILAFDFLKTLPLPRVIE